MIAGVALVLGSLFMAYASQDPAFPKWIKRLKTDKEQRALLWYQENIFYKGFVALFVLGVALIAWGVMSLLEASLA